MNNHNSTYSSINSNNHESDQSYNIYSPHSISYTDYPTTTTKLDVLDYNYWPTTTHNILTNSSNTMLDSIPTETHVPMPIVHLPPLNSSTAITATHHHHHIHQHLYPPVLPSSSPPCSDPSPWIGSTDYQLLHPSINSSSYPHYSTPCSYYHPTNQFYDSAQPQWTSSPPPPPPSSSTIRSIKFESPYTPPPSYFESSDSINHCHEQASEDEPSDSSTWSKLQPIIPPRNPLNGKTRTCDKYRIVYTEQQRIELEKEFMISKYISIPKKASLSLNLSLSERQIKIWFQNRRAKDRKLSKRRQTMSSNYQLNNSNDVDSPSDGDFENSTYYS